MSTRGYSAVGLFSPKSSLNVGSALRAAGCYGCAMLAVSGARPMRYIGRIPTDTHKAYRHMPLIRCDDLREVVPFDCVPVAVELLDSAQSLIEYKHPERAFYVFGPEDGTLGKQVTDWCRDVVYVPMLEDRCMNLAATVNVVLYDRLAKSKRV